MGGTPSKHKIDPKLGFDPNFRQISSQTVARPLSQGDTIISRFVHCVDVYGEDSFMQFKREYASPKGKWETLSYKAFLEIIIEYGSALKASGVQPDDKVILCGETTGEYVLSALAIQLVGGVVVGVHTGFLPSQIETIVNHCKPKVIIGESQVLSNMFDIIKADLKSVVKVEDLPLALKKDDKPHKEHKERNRSNSNGQASNTSNEHKHKESKHKDKPHKEAKSKEVNEQKESTSTHKESTASVDVPKHDTHYVEQVLHHHKKEELFENALEKKEKEACPHDTHHVEHHLHHHKKEDCFEEQLKIIHRENVGHYTFSYGKAAIIVLDAGNDEKSHGVHWTTFLKKATTKVLEEVWVKRKPEDEASIFFTSGTTGFPKGVIHTHRSVVGSADQYAYGYHDTARGRALIMHFPASQLIQTGFLSFAIGGMCFALHPLVDQSLLQYIYPNYLFANPFSLNRGVKEVYSQIGNLNQILRKASKSALNHAVKHAAKELANDTWHEIPRKHQLTGTDNKVIKRIRDKLGSECTAIWVSMAKSDPEVNQFFWGLGVHIFDCYGSTEMNVVCGNTNQEINLHTIGKKFPGVTDIKLDEVTGEILVKSSSLFKGYYVIQPDPEKPDPDSLAFTSDGYYHTGDVGHFNERGFLQIVDRMSHRIKLATCELLSPQKVENILSKSHLVQQVCVFGDEKEYLVAVIKPNMLLASQNGYSKKAIADLIQSSLNTFSHPSNESNSSNYLMPYEVPKKFLLINEPFSRENGMINVGDKTVRGEVYKHFKDEIDFLFTPEGKSKWEGQDVTDSKSTASQVSQVGQVSQASRMSATSASEGNSSHLPQIIFALQTLNDKELDIVLENIASIKKKHEI